MSTQDSNWNNLTEEQREAVVEMYKISKSSSDYQGYSIGIENNFGIHNILNYR